MEKMIDNTFIERCEVHHEGQLLPTTYYNIFTDCEQLCEVSFDDLLIIRNLINQIAEEAKQVPQKSIIEEWVESFFAESSHLNTELIAKEVFKECPTHIQRAFSYGDLFNEIRKHLIELGYQYTERSVQGVRYLKVWKGGDQ